MTTYYLTPISAIFQYFNNQGIVLAGGKVNTYLAGTTTPQVTKTDITGAVSNGNPIILDSAGRLPNVQIWQPGGVNIKVIVTDSANVQIGPTFDQIPGINDPSGLLGPFSNPASGSGADLIANAMRSYDVFASVRASNVPVFQPGQTLIIDVQGATAVNDGVGGLFYWNVASTAADDGQNVLKLAASATGRYIRLAYLVPNGLISYDVFASVRAAVAPVMASGQTLIVRTQGGNAVGDNLGGSFYWSPTSVAADDNANVLKPNSVSGAGRYLLVVEPVAAASVPLAAITQYFNSDLVTSGHTTFPNGLIMQWGTDSGAGVGGPIDIAVTFPITFPNACFAVVVATERSVAVNGQAASGSNFASNITTTGCTIVVDLGAGVNSGTGRWIAVGW